MNHDINEIKINDATRTVLGEMLEHFGMHWLTYSADYDAVEAHMDKPYLQDGDWVSDDVTGTNSNWKSLCDTAVETLILDHDLDIEVSDVDFSWLTEEMSPVYLDDLLADRQAPIANTPKADARNCELARRVAALIEDMGDDPEETADGIRQLTERLDAEHDDFFYHVITTLVETLEQYTD